MIHKIILALVLMIAPTLSASIIKKPPVKVIDIDYPDLVCTETDQDLIHDILRTVAGEGKLTLLFIEADLRAMEAKIAHVHPLKFLSTILTDAKGRHPGLKSCLHALWPDYFKRTGFFKGLSPNLTLESDKGKLHQHIEPFAQEIGVSHDLIRPYFEKRDWEALVEYLLRY